MLSLGLTGGIAAGKSLVSQHLLSRGAIVIDADQLAREVLEPGTRGLERVVEAFGTQILTEDGSLDRAALGGIVFADKESLRTLNSIVHPEVRARAKDLQRSAGPGDIVVQDIPLLVETGQGANFHLVLVVRSDMETRIKRMLERRGMTLEDARARISAQASDAEREAAADVVLENDSSAESLLAAVDVVWDARLKPFAANLAENMVAPRSDTVVLRQHDPSWPAQAARLAARVMHAAGTEAIRVDHIGSTAVPGLAAQDVIDLQLIVRDLAAAEGVEQALGQAGFPRVPGDHVDPRLPEFSSAAPPAWRKRLHAAADPARAVNLHVRAEGSPGADFALAMRDYLTHDAGARERFQQAKAKLAKDADGALAYRLVMEAEFARIAAALAQDRA